MRNLNGKVAFITGGARGIGLGMAQAFAEAGMRIALADIDGDMLAQARDALAASGAQVVSLELDVAQASAWARAAERVEKELGPVAVLCNNAGIGQGLGAPDKPFDLAEVPQERWDLLLATNLTGVYHGIRTFVPRMKAAGGGGHIVNTASMASFLAPAGLSIYSATKFAVLGLSESLRAQLMPFRIGVSALCPGGVQTNFYAHMARLGPAMPDARPHGTPNAPGAPSAQEPIKMAARSVGERVLRAIEDDEFYIITHPEYRPLMQERFESILSSVGESAQPGYADTPAMLQRSINPIYAELKGRLQGKP